MAENAGSAALTGNPDAPDTGAQGEPGTISAPAVKAWYEETVDPKFHDAIKAKEWKGADDVLDSYVNIEKLVSLERGGDVDRIVVKPKADATPEEIAAFRAKAGFAAPENVEAYGFTQEQLEAAPILGEAAKWFKESGVPVDVASNLMTQVLAHEEAQVAAFRAKSDTEYQNLSTEMGDKFGDFEEAGRRAFRESGLTADQLNAVEQNLGTKAMMQMFAKFGSAMSEAGAPQPGKEGSGQFTQSAETAQTRINTLSRDSDFQAKLLSPNPEVRKVAQSEWENLFKTAYPETA